MNKASIKRLFKAIEVGDAPFVLSEIDNNAEALEVVGEHNRLVRDKTPLMYAMQSNQFDIANMLLDHGADATAVMSGGPRTPAISLLMYFAHCDRSNFRKWVGLAKRFYDLGADPTIGLYTALFHYSDLVPRTDLIELSLERGGRIDVPFGDSQMTATDLVSVNRHQYTKEIYKLLKVEQ
ncbi:hypothetical protein [Aporhodopirellula aestuarii]|uniref:Ankyrin repeat domain-containing protein n=1 Tax=Aporhodopirellula aestuarii TaxID=2950107 RepID=A0ABT0UEC6_9BACT|nr:hypothetical protein [Aporhodopirellula aestuarii]MCM2375096.1 hypothetical protein [Aporhodopirellula aestuarii]